VRLRPTLILLVIAAVAAAYFFFVEQPRHRRQVENKITSGKLTQVRADEIVRIVITRPDVTMEFERAGNDWKMIRPVHDAARTPNVNLVLHSITDADIERALAVQEGDIADFGLQTPAASIQLFDASGAQRVAIEVGNLTLTSEFAYVRHEGGGEVALAPTGVRRYALRDVFEFRSPTLVDFENDEVSVLTLSGKTGDRRWQQPTPGDWFTLQDGDTLPGDGEELFRVMGRLRAVRAAGLIDDGPTATDPPAGTIRLDFRDGTALELTFSPEDSSGTHVRTSANPRVAVVDASILDVFELGLDDLRDRHVVSFEAAVVASIVLTTPDISVSIVKRGPSWTFPNPALGSVDQAGVAVLLRELERFKFREIIDEHVSRSQLNDLSAYRLELLDANEEVIDRILAGPVQKIGGVRHASSLSSGRLGIVDTEPLDEIEGLLMDFSGR
jgi:hypothetical protein